MATKIINVLKDDKFQDILDIFKKTSAQEVIFVLPKKHKALTVEEDFEILSASAEEQGKNILILTSNPQINNLALEYSFGVLAAEKPGKPVKGPKEKISKSKKTSEPEMPVESKEEEPVEQEEPAEPEKSVEADLPEQAEESQVVEVVREDDDEQTEEESDQNDPVDEDTVSKDDDNGNDDRWNDDGGAPASVRQEDSYLPDIELTAAKKPVRMLSDIVQPDKEGERVKIGISKKTERPLEVNIKREVPKTDINEIESVWRRPSGPVPGKIKEERIKKPFFRLSQKTLTFLGAGVVILFAVVLYVSTGSAKISVIMRADPLTINTLKVSTSGKFLEVDQELKRIPGQLFFTQKNIEETFPATGEKDVVQKARGKLTVYNEYGTTPQILIATTRFESEGGLVFRTLQTITVPGTKVQNGKIIPGSVQVDVIADKAGDTYNVSPGKFTIPAFKEKGDSDRYQKFYGKSEEAMKGGIIGKAKVVTEQDYVNAKKKIEERVVSETGQELQSQAAGLKILSLSAPVVKDIVSTAQIDEAADNFTLSVKAELETVGFKESDLHALIADYVSKVNLLMILPEKLEIEFKDIKFNSEDKILEFTPDVKGPAYKRIDEEKIIFDLIGKNEKQIKDYLGSVEGILSAKVLLSPPWVKKVPANKEKIEFDIQYE